MSTLIFSKPSVFLASIDRDCLSPWGDKLRNSGDITNIGNLKIPGI